MSRVLFTDSAPFDWGIERGAASPVNIGRMHFEKGRKIDGKRSVVLAVDEKLGWRCGRFGVWRALTLGERIKVLFGAEVGFVLEGPMPPMPPAKDD